MLAVIVEPVTSSGLVQVMMETQVGHKGGLSAHSCGHLVRYAEKHPTCKIYLMLPGGNEEEARKYPLHEMSNFESIAYLLGLVALTNCTVSILAEGKDKRKVEEAATSIRRMIKSTNF